MPRVEPEGENERRNGDPERDILALPGHAEVLERHEGDEREHQQDDVFPESLGMRQVDGFPEAAAVHDRIRDPEDEGDDGEEDDHGRGHDGRQLPVHAGDERRAGYAFQQGQAHTEGLRQPLQESDVEELEVFAHDEARTHRVQQFEQAGEQEGQADKDGAQAPQSMMGYFHTRTGSTAARTLVKISSGGSIRPSASPQSMRRKCGSRAASER